MSLSRLAVVISIAGLSSGCAELSSFLRVPAAAEDKKEASGPPKLYDHLDDLSKFDCPTLREMVTVARKSYFNDDNINEGHLDKSQYGNVVAALAKCGEAKMIFEDIALLGGPGELGFGTSLLVIADRSPANLVFDLFQAYAKANPGSAFLAVPGGRYAADHIAFWLLEDHKDQCDMVDTVTTGSDENVRRQFVNYFVEANCKQAMPFLVERLSSTDPDVRHLACARLGLVGDKSVLDEVDAVANGDNAVHLVERYSDGKYERTPDGRLVTKHFVAEACAIAGSLIRGREKGK